MNQLDLSPDECLLSTIFPEHQPTTTHIILQDFYKCVFKAHFEGRSHQIVRLETIPESDGGEGACHQFRAVAAIQKLAAAQIPPLVPNVFRIGVAVNAEGRQFEFSVMEFVDGVTLQDAWGAMSQENRHSVVADVVGALEKLHSLRLADVEYDILRELDIIDKSARTIGGPLIGFLNDGAALLKALPYPVYFDDLSSITITKSDMDEWVHSAVLCHNDLTPRNLILRRQLKANTAANGSPTTHNYELAAIIDWELAGFYSPSYEIALQDTYLSAGNRHLSFYLLLKGSMKELVPMSQAQARLLQAVELIFESRERKLLSGTNVPAHIRKRFIERLQLHRDPHPYIGWTRGLPDDGTGAAPFEMSEKEADELEDEVIEEMMKRRQSNKVKGT
ncbi:hypothetical protein QBC38DRAFT_523652 [Podospora fimiseda]|uniref:non-specific serine/threonine protein kinase n=1 Tax=Podospora fimiseda TaxID=252190 RepID=A0AAN6YKR5_9PEZI|nr:hypothetical protein QBC38DRAFT_523652 [Podospora fimiseda]